MDKYNLIPKSSSLHVEVNKFIVFDYILDVSIKRIRELQEEIDDLMWEKGVYEIFSDNITVNYLPTEEVSEKAILEELESKTPYRIVPLDNKLMSKISELVEGVEIN